MEVLSGTCTQLRRPSHVVFGKKFGWAGLSAALLSWSNLIEDIYIERRGLSVDEQRLIALYWAEPGDIIYVPETIL